ncbi:MAG: TonB family protein [Magnetococcales bacterium]|nr:TonB family protein [Magnetococcales bacterium]
MNHHQRRFAVSLALAVLLHVSLFLSIGYLLLSSPEEFPEPVTMAHLVSLPPQLETKPEQVDAEAEANHHATPTTPTAPAEARTPPDVAPKAAPPPAAPTPPESMVVPKPVAKPALPKPLAKKTTSKPLAPEPAVKPDTPFSADEADTEPTPEEKAAPVPVRPAHPVATRNAPPSDTRPTPPSLNLSPSIESVSQWDKNRRYQAQSTIRDEAVVDLNTHQTRYATYFARIRQRVEWVWVYPPQASRDKLSGNVVVTFIIQRDGNLLDVQVTRSSGAAILDEAVVQAIHKASPFGPFPEDWSLEKLTIHATFEYVQRELSF